MSRDTGTQGHRDTGTQGHRDTGIDVARGIGIVLVVLGHSQLMAQSRQAHTWLYSFHMPLFLLLAGLFLSRRGAPIEVVRARASAILKPYFVVGSVLAASAAAIAASKGASFEDGFTARLVGLLYGIGSTQVVTPMWFLPFIFLVSVGAWAVIRVAAGSRPAVVAVAALSYTYGVAVLGNPLPWSLDLAPIGIAWALVGWSVYPAIQGRRATGVVALLCVVALLVQTALVVQTGAETNMSRRTMIDPAVATLCAALGVAAVVGLSYWLSQFQVATLVLGYVGERTLFVLIFHDPIQWEVFNRVSLRFGFAAGFVAGLVAGVTLPLCIYEAVRRSPLRRLLLPSKATV